MDKKYLFMILLFMGIAVAVFLVYKSQDLKRAFDEEVRREMEHAAPAGKDILTEEDIRRLPGPVQKYIRYSGALGKEKVRNFRVTFDGEFKADPKKNWARMNAEQYTDLTDTTRLFFMKLNMFGIPVSGLHKYAGAKATMQAKAAGLVTVLDGKGPQMNAGETVTVFNDMCLLAPASLIDGRIEWKAVDSSTVKAEFKNNGIKVSAELYFNEKGELVNFISDDRYISTTGKTYQKARWSTPTKEYRDYNGIRIASGGEAAWSLPEGELSYGRFYVRDIRYNVTP